MDYNGHTIVTGLPTDDVETTIGRLVGWEALVALIGVIAAAGAASFLVRRQLTPLREVAATAREVTQLPLEEGAVGVTVRVPPELTDTETEVGQVGEALNRMLSHVESALDARHHSEQQVRQFVADASHELRTPLSTIQGYAELTRRTASTDEATLRLAMSKVETESGRMATLVDDLLLLARLDAGRPLERADVDLTRLIVEAVNDVRVVDDERHWRLSLADEPVHVTGDAQRLHQVLSNLLSNARRHTGKGTTVTVGARPVKTSDAVQLSVHDDGPGMPEALRGKEFERFSRGDESRTRASGGAGLGLSIVKAIVSAHRGSVAVKSQPGDTTITVTLPAGAPSEPSHSQGTG
jgi:two-component system OmpR family sensor kinase